MEIDAALSQWEKREEMAAENGSDSGEKGTGRGWAGSGRGRSGSGSAAMVWLRVGALSGSVAVAAAAYGAHGFRRSDRDDYQKEIFDTANRYHLLHSLVLLSVPRCRRPSVAGALLCTGMSLFCGPFYYFAITGDPSLNRAAPVGGTLLILGWAAMAL
ncbi:transmembrane protein 256 [Coturnix japonica]|uniref:Transmembrane protein 256 n=1 Tax=Coturnix japonica TaxID=93934 RepID=A0A8C2SQ35_COTJA|nr:transmembrane protein 256 [Coturnix japonica]